MVVNQELEITHLPIGDLRPDPANPRRISDEELEAWKQRDPIDIHKALLLSQDVADQAEIDQMEDEIKAQIDEAGEFARESPYPDPSELFDDMFANPIPLD